MKRRSSASAVPSMRTYTRRDLPAFYAEGARDAANLLEERQAPADPLMSKLDMNWSWTRCWSRRRMPAASEAAIRAGSAYADGFADSLRIPRQDWLPVALRKTASAIITGGRDIDIGAVRELMRLPFQDVFVVLEESADASVFKTVRTVPGVTIIHAAEPPHKDEGSGIGAKLAQTDFVFFADGRSRLPAERLVPFLAAVDGGADIALADRMPLLGAFRSWDDLSRVKAFVNLSLGRPDLLANSAAALPNAWSKKALDSVGPAVLAVPALAHQSAIERKLSFARCPAPEGRNARHAPPGGETADPARTIGDYVFALKAAMKARGGRMAHRDKVRRRGVSGGGSG